MSLFFKLFLQLDPYPQYILPVHFVQCEPAVIDFATYIIKPNGSPNLRYSWYFGNGDSLVNSKNGNPQGIKYPVTKEGWYDLRIKVTNQWGADSSKTCSVTKDSADYIRVLPQPHPKFTSDPDFFTTVAFPKFKFINQTSIKWGKMTYLWNFNSNNDPDDTSTQTSPIHTYPADTTAYWVNLTSTYSYHDTLLNADYQCWDSVGQIRKIGPDVTVFVPTAFSPEGTGPKTNNVFNAVVKGEKSFHVEVFNRWGEKLWESDNKFQTWNGNFKGEDCQQEVYAWVVKVTDLKDGIYKFEGTVSLLK